MYILKYNKSHDKNNEFWVPSALELLVQGNFKIL